MSDVTQIVNTLEDRISKLFSKISTLEQTNLILKSEITEFVTTIKNQSNAIEVLKTQYDSLKMANSILGSNENKRDTKLKINSLIREIDYCIAQLSD